MGYAERPVILYLENLSSRMFISLDDLPEKEQEKLLKFLKDEFKFELIKEVDIWKIKNEKWKQNSGST